MDAAEAVVLPANGFIEVAREQVKYPAMVKILLGTGVLFFEDLLRESDAALACVGLDEVQELPAGEVTGMRCHKVQKTRFFFGVAKTAKGFHMASKVFHKAKILAVISCESSTRRSLSWSCGRAKT